MLQKELSDKLESRGIHQGPKMVNPTCLISHSRNDNSANGSAQSISNIICTNPYQCNVFSFESSVCLAVPQLHQPDQRKPNTDFSPRIQDGGRTKNYHWSCCWSSASVPPIIGSLPVNMSPSGSSSDVRLRDLNKFKINSKYFSSFSKILTIFRLRLGMCSC